MDGGVESFSSSSFNFKSSFGVYSDTDQPVYGDDTDAYFELELRPQSCNNEDQEFEFRVSLSAIVPFTEFMAASSVSSKCEETEEAAALDSLSQHPQPPATPGQINSWGLVQSRKSALAKMMNKSSMMKFLVKLRSIISIRGSIAGGDREGQARVGVLERWFGGVLKQGMNGGGSHEGKIMVRRNWKLFGNPFKISKTFPTASCIIKSSPLLQQPATAADHTSLVHSAIAHCKKSLIPLNHDHFSF